MADAFPPVITPVIDSIDTGSFVGAGLPRMCSFHVRTSRFAGGSAALFFNGVEVAAPVVEVVRPVEPGVPGQLLVTIDMAALEAGPHALALRDANGDSPGVQIFIARE